MSVSGYGRDEFRRGLRDKAQEPPDACGKDVGSKPYWMGVDQYDPCPCILPKGHESRCACRHAQAEPAR